MQLLYNVIGNYGITIIIFTILIRLLMFPLSLKQQKSQARMSAYQPMIKEIQNKWANDKQKQQQEIQKFYEENNLKMSAGCAPMLVNMIVLFGMIAVIQAPMQYMLNISTEEIQNATAIVNYHKPDTIKENDQYTQQSVLIDEFKNNPQIFLEGIDITEEAPEAKSGTSVSTAASASASVSGSASNSNSNSAQVNEDGSVTRHISVSQETIDKVQGFKFSFFGLNLANKPNFKSFPTLILPILSILTMFASQFIIMKTSGQAGASQGSMWVMTIVMGVMFGWFAFTIPAGFSLYYTASNIVMTVQQLIVRKIHDPEKVREEIEREIEERKKAKKAKKKVAVKDETGNLVAKEVSEAELAKIRLAKARELDAEKYADNEEDIVAARLAAEKAQKMDEAKYGLGGKKTEDEPEAAEDESTQADSEEAEIAEMEQIEAAAEADEVEAEVEAVEEAQQEQKEEYKPGRRKRAKQKKAEDQPGLAKEMQDEAEKEDME